MNVTHFARHDFVLHPSGAAYWPAYNLLLVADVHLGKVAHFRKAGMAVPPASILANFRKLDEVVAYFEPTIICFMGDLFHSDLNREWELFSAWSRGQSAQLMLVAGNHDIVDRSLYYQLSIDVIGTLVIDGIWLTHQPDIHAERPNICGHVHPCVSIRGMGRQRIKLPRFFQSENQLILPAFGTFTGMYELFPTEADDVFVIADKEVIRV